MLITRGILKREFHYLGYCDEKRDSRVRLIKTEEKISWKSLKSCDLTDTRKTKLSLICTLGEKGYNYDSLGW